MVKTKRVEQLSFCTRNVILKLFLLLLLGFEWVDNLKLATSSYGGWKQCCTIQYKLTTWLHIVQYNQLHCDFFFSFLWARVTVHYITAISYFVDIYLFIYFFGHRLSIGSFHETVMTINICTNLGLHDLDVKSMWNKLFLLSFSFLLTYKVKHIIYNPSCVLQCVAVCTQESRETWILQHCRGKTCVLPIWFSDPPPILASSVMWHLQWLDSRLTTDTAAHKLPVTCNKWC